MSYADIIGTNLKNLRVNKKITQDKMANILNVKRQTYSAYERGVSIPDAGTLKILADFFHVTTDYLLSEDHPVALFYESSKNNFSSLNTTEALHIALEKLLGQKPSDEEFKKFLSMTKLFFDISE